MREIAAGSPGQPLLVYEIPAPNHTEILTLAHTSLKQTAPQTSAMAPLFGAAAQKAGKLLLQTSVGASIIAGITHILGPKNQQETIENKGFNQMRIEKNSNIFEVNIIGMSGVILIGAVAIILLCLCGKITTFMTKCKKCKKMKERKQEERMEMVNLKKRRNEEKEEDKGEKEEEEKKKKEEEEEALKDI